MSFEESASEPLRLSDCGVAGPIFDLVKLESISREFISQLSTDDALSALTAWAQQYDPQLIEILSFDPVFTRRILAAQREPGVMQRKDLAKWSDFRSAYGLYFPGLFTLMTDPADARFHPVEAPAVRSLAKSFADSYQHSTDKTTWFEQIRTLASSHGFASTPAEFKKAPHDFVGSISHVSNVIRVALTGLTHSPELFVVAQNIGREEVLRRVRALT